MQRRKDLRLGKARFVNATEFVRGKRDTCSMRGVMTKHLRNMTAPGINMEFSHLLGTCTTILPIPTPEEPTSDDLLPAPEDRIRHCKLLLNYHLQYPRAH